jgi:endonuclease-3
MAVDTHVFRVSKRLGLVAAKAKTPLEVEQELL